MEHDQRLSSPARTNRLTRHDDVPGYGSSVDHLASKLPGGGGRIRPRYEPSAPLTPSLGVLPAVHSRPGHRHTVIRHVTKSETPMLSCHIDHRSTPCRHR
jgi:hypothetical protein